MHAALPITVGAPTLLPPGFRHSFGGCCQSYPGDPVVLSCQGRPPAAPTCRSSVFPLGGGDTTIYLIASACPTGAIQLHRSVAARALHRLEVAAPQLICVVIFFRWRRWINIEAHHGMMNWRLQAAGVAVTGSWSAQGGEGGQGCHTDPLRSGVAYAAPSPRECRPHGRPKSRPCGLV